MICSWVAVHTSTYLYILAACTGIYCQCYILPCTYRRRARERESEREREREGERERMRERERENMAASGLGEKAPGAVEGVRRPPSAALRAVRAIEQARERAT